MTSKTLTMKLKERQKQGKSLFVPYIMAGANGLERLPAEIELLATHGAAAIEIGVPFSDPVADGAVIQAAGMQALANGTTLKKIIAALQTIHSEVPLVLMGYANSFFHYGIEQLANELKTTNVKGLIIPDLPFEHRSLVTPTFDAADLALITLVFDQSSRQNSDADRRSGRIRLCCDSERCHWRRSPIQRTAGSAFASHFGKKSDSSTSWFRGLDPRRRAALCPSVRWGSDRFKNRSSLTERATA